MKYIAPQKGFIPIIFIIIIAVATASVSLGVKYKDELTASMVKIVDKIDEAVIKDKNKTTNEVIVEKGAVEDNDFEQITEQKENNKEEQNIKIETPFQNLPDTQSNQELEQERQRRQELEKQLAEEKTKKETEQKRLAESEKQKQLEQQQKLEQNKVEPQKELKYCIEKYCFATEKAKNNFIYDWNHKYLVATDNLIIQAEAVRDYHKSLIGAFNYLLAFNSLAQSQESRRQEIINDYDNQIAQARKEMEQEIGGAEAQAYRAAGGHLGYSSTMESYINNLRQSWEKRIADLERDKQYALNQLESISVSSISSTYQEFVTKWNNKYTEKTEKWNKFIGSYKTIKDTLDNRFYQELFSAEIQDILYEQSNILKSWLIVAHNDFLKQSNIIKNNLSYYSSSQNYYDWRDRLDALELKFQIQDIIESLDGINTSLRHREFGF